MGVPVPVGMYKVIMYVCSSCGACFWARHGGWGGWAHGGRSGFCDATSGKRARVKAIGDAQGERIMKGSATRRLYIAMAGIRQSEAKDED